MNILRVETDRHKETMLIHQRVNGNFIKHKSGIYTRGQRGKAPSHPEQWKRLSGVRHPRPGAAAGGRRMGPTVGSLLAGGITITKEGQVLSKLNPQAGARAEKPGSQR